MTDLSVDTVKAEIARLRRESDQHHLLGSDLDQMRRTLNAAMERMRIAEDKADDAERLTRGLREQLEVTQAALRRYMSADGGCDCLQCDEEPPRAICCESCFYCHGRYALGEVLSA